jgi:hypothetical protein
MASKHSQASVLRRAVTTVLAVTALGLSPLALADATKEADLEARIAELEKIVKQLQAEKAATPAPAPAVAAAPAAPKPDKPVQAGTITPNAVAGTTFIFTGFAKMDGLFTDTKDGELADSSVGRDFYVPGTIPIDAANANGTPMDESGYDLNVHAKQSRLIFGTDTPVGDSKLSTRFEIDFYGSITGDQRVTNTYAPVLRQAYVQYKNWLVGQSWSNFQDTAVLVDSVDFIGASDGTVFVRQPQVRYTVGGLSLSAENPETTITPYHGGTGGNARISSDDNAWPDLIARYTWKGSWGHVSIAGMARELKYQNYNKGAAASTAIDDSMWSAAGSLTGKFMLGKDDIRFMLNYGNLGRYVGVNFTNDAVIDQNNQLQSIDGVAGLLAYRHVWSDKWRSNLYGSYESYDNDVNLTGGWVNKASHSWAINTFYSPLPKWDVGAEFRWAVRELENGEEGKLNRFQLTTKYSF